MTTFFSKDLRSSTKKTENRQKISALYPTFSGRNNSKEIKMAKQKVNQQIVHMAEIAVLTAIIILMAFTPIGYIKTAGLEITLITIPVIVGAIVLGPAAGAFLGAVFGVTSFLQSVLALSPFGVMLLEINPFFCFVVCIPTRILMGFCTGLIFKAFRTKNALAYSVSGLCGALLNTLFFMGTLVALYWKTDYIQGIADTIGATNIFLFVILFVGINGLIEALCCFVIAAGIAKAVNRFIEKV